MIAASSLCATPIVISTAIVYLTCFDDMFKSTDLTRRCVGCVRSRLHSQLFRIVAETQVTRSGPFWLMMMVEFHFCAELLLNF